MQERCAGFLRALNAKAMILRVLPPCAAILIAGCTSTEPQGFPSLASRAVERQGFEEPTAPPPSPARPDPALDAKIAAVAARADERGRAFEIAHAAARAKVAAAAPASVGSEPWLDAQVALGELDVARAEASEAVTTLEELAADRAVAGGVTYPALDAAVAEARVRQDAVSAAIADLNARLTR